MEMIIICTINPTSKTRILFACSMWNNRSFLFEMIITELLIVEACLGKFMDVQTPKIKNSNEI